MKEPKEKAPENKIPMAHNQVAPTQNTLQVKGQFKDNRPETAQLHQLQEMANNSTESLQLKAIKHMTYSFTNLDAPLQFKLEDNVIQMGKGDGKDDGEKKKGDDYCNNIGKTLGNLENLLAGFFNDAIRSQIAIINANRSKCSVTTSLVEGDDTNTAEYGQFSTDLMAIVNQIAPLLNESDKAYFNVSAKASGIQLYNLFNNIPTVAIDERVAAVIQAGTEGDANALAAINAALAALRDALRARVQEYLKSIGPYKKKDDDEPKGPGKGPGGGAGALGGGNLVGTKA
jgi:hypothetical protein